MPRTSRQLIAMGTLAIFSAVLVAVFLCGSLHIVVPIPWVRQVTGCQLTLDEHAGVIADLTGTFGKMLIMFTVLLAAFTFIKISPFASAVGTMPFPRYLRLHPPRRDRLLECFRTGILNPKIF